MHRYKVKIVGPDKAATYDHVWAQSSAKAISQARAKATGLKLDRPIKFTAERI